MTTLDGLLNGILGWLILLLSVEVIKAYRRRKEE